MENTIKDKIAKAVNMVSFLDLGVFTLEFYEEAIIFTIQLRNGENAIVRYHLYDEVPDHDTSLSHWVGKTMSTNSVGQFEEIIKLLKI